MKQFLAILWGGNAGLAREEVKALLETYGSRGQLVEISPRLVLGEASSIAADAVLRRAACVRHAGLVVGRVDGEIFADLSGYDLDGFKVLDLTGSSLQSRIGDWVRTRWGGRVDLDSPATVLVVLRTQQGIVLVAESFVEKRFWHRKMGRPYVRIGALHPQLARCMVNLARAKENFWFFDPFSGSSAITVEAALVGALSISSDLDYEACKGGMLNAAASDVEICSVNADAFHQFLRDGSVASLATDPPFGRLSSTHRLPRDKLFSDVVKMMGRLLMPNAGFSVLIPQGIDLASLPWKENGLKVLAVIPMRAHRSFIRYLIRGEKATCASDASLKEENGEGP